MSSQVFLDQTQNLRKRPDERWQSFIVTYRDLRALKFNILTPFIPILHQPGWHGHSIGEWQHVIERLKDLSKKKSTQAPLIFLTDQQCPEEISQSEFLKGHSIAIVDKKTSADFAAAGDWRQKWMILGRALSHYLGMTAVHPYVRGTPAYGGRFFGRSNYIKQIIEGKTIRNCTIVGNRRIGKTSLMNEVREKLKDAFSLNESIYFVDLYAANLKSTWDAVYLTCSQLNINLPTKFTKFGAIQPRYVTKFPDLLRAFAAERQAAIVIFIDEFDIFLEIDAKQDYQFLHLLRDAVTTSGSNCYVVIAGFRRLMETRVNQKSPYFNFTDEIKLKPLTPAEITEMITLPMDHLGLDIQSTNLPALIQQETHGQPELIQTYCRAVVDLHVKTGRVPHDNELQDYVSNDLDFARLIVDNFLNNTNSYEQVICLNLMQKAFETSADYSSFKFTIKDVDEIQKQFSFNLNNAAMRTLLNNLEVGSTVERVLGTPGEYRFVVPQLLRFCRINIHTLAETAQSEARRNPPSIETLNMESRSEKATH